MEIKAHGLMPNFADLLLDTIFLVDAHGCIVYVNAACERIFGYTPDEMIGQSMINFVAPEDRARTMDEARHVMAGHPRIGFENRYIRKDGRQVHIMWSARWSEVDQLRIGVARDVTELTRLEAMQAATYAISEAAHNAGDLVGLFQEIHRIIAKLVPVAEFTVATCEPKTQLIDLAYELDSDGSVPVTPNLIARQYCAEVIQSRQTLFLPVDAQAAISDCMVSISDSGCWLAMPLITQQMAIGALVLKSRPGTIYSEKDKELMQFVSAQVATAIERRQLHADLLHSARYDQLTGLPNRRLFDDRIKSALARCRRNQSGMALLFVDIDGFKQVNDSRGHAVGDRLLQEVALRLEQCTREEDTVARLGGDEFVVLLEETHAQEDALSVANKIRHLISQTINIDGVILHIRASIGIAVYPEHGVEIAELLRHADKEMYMDKKLG
jgi:diguanylate cyclase (GGDEF)-like protein/PAS domain S-box-containing protein